MRPAALMGGSVANEHHQGPDKKEHFRDLGIFVSMFDLLNLHGVVARLRQGRGMLPCSLVRAQEALKLSEALPKQHQRPFPVLSKNNHCTLYLGSALDPQLKLLAAKHVSPPVRCSAALRSPFHEPARLPQARASKKRLPRISTNFGAG